MWGQRDSLGTVTTGNLFILAGFGVVPYSNGGNREHRFFTRSVDCDGPLVTAIRNWINWASSNVALEMCVSEKNPIRLFVSHLFAEDADYLRVFEFLESVDRFFYINVSKPEAIPQSGGLEAIKDEFIAQIKEAEAVVVLATHFEENKELIEFQMDVAEANEKPIIVIRPFGGLNETADELVERVKEHVVWNDREIADAIRRQARLEDTARWDVIDFP